MRRGASAFPSESNTPNRIALAEFFTKRHLDSPGCAHVAPVLTSAAMEYRNKPSIHPAWYLVAFILVAFLAGLAIKFYRTGVLW